MVSVPDDDDDDDGIHVPLITIRRLIVGFRARTNDDDLREVQ